MLYAVWCDRLIGTGYQGLFLVAELQTPDAAYRRAILAKADTDALEAVAAESGWRTIRQAGRGHCGRGDDGGGGQPRAGAGLFMTSQESNVRSACGLPCSHA